jgi:hypothetical protein
MTASADDRVRWEGDVRTGGGEEVRATTIFRQAW